MYNKIYCDIILDGQNLSSTLGKLFSQCAAGLINHVSKTVDNYGFKAIAIVDNSYYETHLQVVDGLLEIGYDITIYPKAQTCNVYGRTSIAGFDHDPLVMGLLSTSKAENIILGSHDGDYSRIVSLLSRDRKITIFGDRQQMSKRLIHASNGRLIDANGVLESNLCCFTGKPGKLTIFNN